MKHYVIHIMICCCLSVFAGCGSSNPDAPSAGAVHPDAWLSFHGAEADDDLRGCQGCHGFDYHGSGEAVSCFSCHLSGPPFGLHPAEWDDVGVDHQNFASSYSWTGCAVEACHGIDLQDGNGPSCLNGGCHTETVNPVPTSHRGVAFTDPDVHGPDARDNMFTCLNCHGRPTNIVDGGFVSDLLIMDNLDHSGGSVVGSCATCHPAAGAHPTDWQGGNDQDLTYAASHRRVNQEAHNRSCALCHNVESPGSGPVADAPSCFSSDHTNANGLTTGCHPGGPQTAPHPIDGSYRPAAEHGQDAKLDLAACQSCHADSAGSNPRFNVPIGELAHGCEDCHNDFTAHPSTGGRDNIDWYDVDWRHTAANISAATCGVCHPGLGGAGTVGPACTDCHVSDPSSAIVGSCTSCHGDPPNGSTRPNRDGEHLRDPHEVACDVCHTNPGPGSADHFTRPNPDYAKANLRSSVVGTTMSITVTPTNVTCTGNCHSGHNESWY